MHQSLEFLVSPDQFDNFKLSLSASTFNFFNSFFDKESEDKAESIGRGPHNGISLIVDCKFFSHVEQFVGLKEDGLTV